METWRDRNAAQWMQSLAEGEPEARDSVPNLGAIAQLTSYIESEHARHARRRRLRRGLAAATGVLALAAGGFIWVRATSSDEPAAVAEVRAVERQVTLEGAADGGRLAVGKPLAAGATIVTGAEAAAALAVTGGGSLKMSAFSELRLAESRGGGRLSGARLGRGIVEVDLPPQPEGDAFFVSTPDARVTVVGTKFKVRIAESSAGPITCVDVAHGRVRVESSTRHALLGAGESWASRGELSTCSQASASSAEPARVDSELTTPDRPATTTSARPAGGAPAASPVKPGTLAEENRLFLELVRARRAGDHALARELQRKFLTRYPGSPLAAQVREEQSRTP